MNHWLLFFIFTMLHSFLGHFVSSLPATIGYLSLLVTTLLFYGWLAYRASKKALLKTAPFTLWDALVAAILVTWFLAIIVTSLGKDQAITLQVILLNSLLYVFLISGITGFMTLRGLSPVKIFGLAPEHPAQVLKLAPLWLLACYPLIAISQGIIQILFGTSNDVQEVVLYFLNHHGWHERLAIITMAVIVAPIAEELIFRGYIYGVLRRFAGRIPAIIFSSILFAAIHLHLPSILGLGLLAVILCLLYERTGSLWANILLHATFNGLSIVALLFFPNFQP